MKKKHLKNAMSITLAVAMLSSMLVGNVANASVIVPSDTDVGTGSGTITTENSVTVDASTSSDGIVTTDDGIEISAVKENLTSAVQVADNGITVEDEDGLKAGSKVKLSVSAGNKSSETAKFKLYFWNYADKLPEDKTTWKSLLKDVPEKLTAEGTATITDADGTEMEAKATFMQDKDGDTSTASYVEVELPANSTLSLDVDVSNEAAGKVVAVPYLETTDETAYGDALGIDWEEDGITVDDSIVIEDTSSDEEDEDGIKVDSETEEDGATVSVDDEAAQDEISSNDIDDNNVDAEETYTINTSINQNAGMVDVMTDNQIVNSVLYNEDADDTIYDDTSVDRGENVSFRISAYAGFKISEYKLCDSDGTVLLESSDINEEDWYQTTVDCIALTDMNFSVSFVEDDSYQSDELEGRYNEVYTADTLIIGKGEEFDPENSIDDIKLYAKEGEEIKLVYSDLDTTAIGKYTTIYHITAEDDSEFFAVKRPVEVVEDPETVTNTGDYQIIATETMAHGVNFDIDKQSYDEGDIVNFSVTPLNGNILNSVKAYLGNEAEDTNEVFGDEIGLTKLDSKPNADGNSASEKDEALFINEDTQYYSFTMPASDVFLSFDTESGISMFADTGDTTELTKFTVNQTGNSFYFYNSSVCYRQGGTRYRTVSYKYKDEDGVTQTQTVMCYCIQPSKNAPLKDGNTIFSSSNGKVVALSDASRVSKVLYYGYGGPGWGKSVECSDGVTRNLKTSLSRYPNNSTMPGCQTDTARYFTLTHFLASYAYLPSHPEIWNYPLDGFSDLGPFLNGAGQAWIKNMYDELASYPKPTVMYRSKNAEITGGKITKDQMKLQSDGTYITPLIQYYTYDENTATIKLPAGVTIKEKNGTIHKGKTKLTGGTYFYVIFDLNKVELPKNRTFLFDSVAKYGANFQAWKILTGENTAQDLGFAYKTGDKTIGFQIELPLPEKGGFQLGKFLYDFDNFAGKTDRDYIKTEFTIYKTFNASEPDNLKALSDVVQTIKVEDTTKNLKSKTLTVTGLQPGTYYLFETGRCPGAAQNLNIYSFVITEGQTEPTTTITNVRTNNTGTKVGNRPFRYTGKLLGKVDADGNPLKLKDAIFKVVYSPYRQSESGYKEMYTWFLKTDENGEVYYDAKHWVDSWNGMKSDAPLTLDDGNYAIPSGTLYLTEVEAPDGYDIDGKTHELLLNGEKDENGYYSIPELTATPIKVVEPEAGDKWKVRVNLKKVDENGDGLAGAIFDVWDNEACEGNPVAELTSKEDGTTNIAVIKDVKWENETYTLWCKEIQPPAGYTQIKDKFSLTFERKVYETEVKKDKKYPGELKSFGPKSGIINEETPGTPTPTPPVETPTPTPPTGAGVHVKKVSTAEDDIMDLHGYTLKGAKFHIYGGEAGDGNRGDSRVDTYVTTDENGISETVSLPDPSWYEYPSHTDSNGNTIYDTPILHPVTTVYTITEVEPPHGHKMAAPKSQQFSVTMPYDKDKVFEKVFTDEPKFTKKSLQLDKVSSKGNSIKGVVFKVEFFDTELEGVNYDAGATTYALDDEDYAATMDADEDVGIATLEAEDDSMEVDTINVQSLPDSELVVMSSNGGSNSIKTDSEAKITDTGMSGTPTRTWYLQSDDKGLVLMDDDHVCRWTQYKSDPFYKHNNQIVIPLYGTLQITEVQVPAEYIMCDEILQFPTTENGDLSARIYNDLEPCKVNIQKFKDDGTTAIPGVEFELKFVKQSEGFTSKQREYKRLLKEGETVTRSTDWEGNCYFDQLDQGDYEITEIKTASGQTLLKDPIKLTIPFKMTNEEASEYEDVNFESAREDNDYTNKWFFYECSYIITNTPVFDLPHTGATGTWNYGFVGLGIALAAGSCGAGAVLLGKRRKRRKLNK